MAVKVLMPKWGLTMQEATIVRWLKREGETVHKDEPLLEVETEKIATDVAAPGSGILARIVAAEGEAVPVGNLIAIIAEDPDEEIPGLETGAPTEPARDPT
jgi:pyruvate/2-oxoglutarate dehydrogenase complex dihydrolipoamide acyltransferase (E2) component